MPKKWRAWQDSNLQPLGPKPSTLSIELQAHLTGESSRITVGASDGIRTRDLLCHRQAPWASWLRSPRWIIYLSAAALRRVGPGRTQLQIGLNMLANGHASYKEPQLALTGRPGWFSGGISAHSRIPLK